MIFIRTRYSISRSIGALSGTVLGALSGTVSVQLRMGVLVGPVLQVLLEEGPVLLEQGPVLGFSMTSVSSVCLLFGLVVELGLCVASLVF